MSNYDNNLAKWNTECIDAIHKAQKVVDDACEANVEQFQRNTIDNIPQEFGDFLYTSVGDRVTSQRVSILNQSFFDETEEGKEIVKEANKQNISILEYLQNLQKDNKVQSHSDKSYYYSTTPRNLPVELYISTGRKFGVSYITGSNGNRINSIYIGKGKIFKFLTQEHVDCIKDKQKHECTQDFLNFRDDFVNGLNDLNSLITTPQDVKLGVLSSVVKNNKLQNRNNGYNDTSKQTYTIMDYIMNNNITHTIASVPKTIIWDKHKRVFSRSVRRERTENPSYISFIFLNINDDTKIITMLGNIDISVDEFTHSLQNKDVFSYNNSLQHAGCVEIPYHLTDMEVLKYYKNYSVSNSKGIILNMDAVMDNTIIKNEMERRIKFYNDMSSRLQELKHKHAGLYFLNADL